MNKNTKFIFVTGGVLSGVGKGIAAASIGNLLKSAGLKVSIQKFDGYLNVDPGTMNPTQHGEVFVTDDGTETDLDLGHYERFIDIKTNKLSNFTSGQLYTEIIEKERKGDYLGGTVQVVPHLTDLVKEKMIKNAEEANADVAIIEIGGTVGDLENAYFIEAARQMRWERNYHDVMFIHITLLPFIQASKELKTKPTQSSVRQLRSLGIQPDMLLLRGDYDISNELIRKVALRCDVHPENVFPAPTIKSIYDVPINFEKFGVDNQVIQHLKLGDKNANISEWKNFFEKVNNQLTKEVKIAIVGKYVELEDSYISVVESIKHACWNNSVIPKINFIDSEKADENILKEFDGIVIPGGFGKRGIEGKINTAKFCRENKVPYLGLCLGSQIMAIEFARNVCGFENANSTEFDEQTPHPVVHIMEDQKTINKKGGTMRLGAYDCTLNKESKSYKLYGQEKISERHRHRFEFNNEYRKTFEENGLVIAGINNERNLVEIIEIKNHPFMIASQFHPEFKSRPLKPAPLFNGFIKAIVGKNID